MVNHVAIPGCRVRLAGLFGVHRAKALTGINHREINSMEVGIVVAMIFVGVVGLIAGLVVGSYHRSRTIKQLRRQMRTARRNKETFFGTEGSDPDA